MRASNVYTSILNEMSYIRNGDKILCEKLERLKVRRRVSR